MTATWGTLLCVHPCISRRPSYYNGEGLVPLRSHRVDCSPQKLFSGRQSKQRSWFAGVHAVAHGDGEMPRFSFIQKLKNPSGISFGEELMRLIAGASSAPIAQYISSPRTLLHSLDPRVKQNLDQLGRVSFLSVLLLLMVSLGADSIPPIVQTRTPPPQLCGIPPLPSSFTAYKYVLWKLGPFQLTRKGLALGTTSACLSFTVLQSASLCLSTTMPEHLAEGIRWYLAPLRWLKAPVDEIILTLLLSLRFVALVFDEVRNIALGIVARGVQWKKLSSLETAEVFFTFLGRVFKNLFNHSEQIAQAMVVRGFQGDAAAHKVYYMANFSLQLPDYIAILALSVLIGVGVASEIMLC